MEIPCADFLCKASRQLLCTVLHGASALAGRRGDGGLGDFRQSLNNHRQGRVLVSGCGGIVFLPFLSQNMCCAHPGEKRS